MTFKQTGIKLLVTPHVTNNRQIVLDILAELQRVQLGFQQAGGHEMLPALQAQLRTVQALRQQFADLGAALDQQAARLNIKIDDFGADPVAVEQQTEARQSLWQYGLLLMLVVLITESFVGRA